MAATASEHSGPLPGALVDRIGRPARPENGGGGSRLVWDDGRVLIRKHDDGTEDESRWRAFVAAQGFGHLVAGGTAHAVPVVVPTQFLLDGDQVILHLAAPNPFFDAVAVRPTVVLSVAGDWAYIPGAWKAVGDEDPRLGIPTTYYGAVQLTGSATVVDDADGIAAILRRQLADLEPAGGLVDPLEHARRFPAIRGIVIDVTEVRAKFKYGGNVDEVHRRRVADELAARGGPGDEAARAHVLRNR